MEEYRTRLPQLSEFSKADQLPCVVRVEESSSALPQLRPGTRLVLLSVQSEDAVLIGEERTGVKYQETCLSGVETRFSVLPQHSRDDNLLFRSVEDIAGLQGSDQPEYVRAVQGWEPLIDKGEIFRVSSAVQRDAEGTFCAKWERMQIEGDGPWSQDLAKCACREMLIAMDLEIGFSTSLERNTYTLSEIVEKHRKGDMMTPRRLQLEEQDEDPALNSGQRRQGSTTYVLEGVYKATVLLAMKTFVPGGTVAGRPFLRIPSTTAESVTVSPVLEPGVCRADMAHVMDVLLRGRDFTGAATVRNRTCTVPFLVAPPIPPRAGDDDGNDGNDNDDSVEDTEAYETVPTSHGRPLRGLRHMDAPALPPRSPPTMPRSIGTLPRSSPALPRPQITTPRLPLSPSLESGRMSSLAAEPGRLPMANAAMIAAPSRSPSLDFGKQHGREPDSSADHSTSATPDRLPCTSSSVATVNASPGGNSVDEPPPCRQSRSSVTAGVQPPIKVNRQVPSPIIPRRIEPASHSPTIPRRNEPIAHSPTSAPVTASSHNGGGRTGDDMYVDLVASIEARNKKLPQTPSPPTASPRLPTPAARQAASRLTAKQSPCDGCIVQSADADDSTSGGDDFPLPPPTIRSLSSVELIDKLQQADLSHYAQIFRSRGIDGEAFCELDDHHLQCKIGVIDEADLEAFRNLRMQ